MKHRFIRAGAAAALAFLLAGTAARADYAYRDANNSIQTFSAWTIGGKILPISSAVDANGLTIYGTAGSPNADVLTFQGISGGFPLPISLNSASISSANITIVDSGSTSTTGQNSAPIITGAPTSASSVSAAVSGAAVVRFQLSGTWTGTVQIEQSIDGGTTWGLLACHINGTDFNGSTATANGIFDCEAAGATNVRVRATATMTGTLAVLGKIIGNSSVVKVVSTIGVKDPATGNKIAIKSASTAPVSTDAAAVVALSPNTGEVGTPGSGISQPSSGVGVSGWLSGIYKAVTGTLTFVQAPIAPVASSSAESNHVLKNSAGNLYDVYVVPTVAGYLMVFDATSAPSDGSVTPKECVPAAANVPTAINFGGAPPESYATGIVAVFSTTGCLTKTASSTGWFHGRVQ